MRSRLVALSLCVVAASLLGTGRAGAQPPDSGSAPPAPPPARKVPGLTAADPFPKGCVSCHVNMPDRKMDARLSTLLKGWTTKVEPALLAKAQAAAPAGIQLKGKHPAATSALKNIPAGCIKCHGSTSKKAPPFTRLLHLVHLTGEGNHYLAEFQGECTFCHKLDRKTGAWSIPSGPEP